MATWSFEVLDHLSEPFKAMAANSKVMEAKLHGAGDELKRYEAGLHKVSHAHHEAHESGSLLGKMFGAEGFFAAEMIEKAAELGHEIYEIGERFAEAAIEAGQFKRQAETFFDLAGFHGEDADDEFEILEKIVKGTAMTKQTVLAEFQELFSFTDRYGGEATENVIAAGADIQKALGNNASQAFVGVIKNIEAMGGLTKRTVRQLRETGIATPSKLYEAVAEELKVSTKQAEKMIGKGLLSQEKSIDILLGMVQSRIDKGGPLGSFSKQRTAGNVDDQLKNLKEEFEAVFQDIDTSPIADAIGHIAHAFAKGTESGDKMREKAEKLFESIAHGAEWAAHNIPGLIDQLSGTLDVLEKIAVVLKPIGWAIKGVMNVGFMATSIATGNGPRTMYDADQIDKENRAKEAAVKADIERMNAQIDELSKATAEKVVENTRLETAMRKSGVDAGSGFMEGFAASITPDATSKVMQEGVLDAVATKLDMHSPSRVLEKRGKWAGQGFNIGFERELVSGSFGMGNILGPSPAPVAPIPAGGGIGRAPISIQAHTEIKFDGAAPSNPQQLADLNHMVDSAVQRGIMRALEQIGVEN